MVLRTDFQQADLEELQTFPEADRYVSPRQAYQGHHSGANFVAQRGPGVHDFGEVGDGGGGGCA
jgi:hypothetical protein